MSHNLGPIVADGRTFNQATGLDLNPIRGTIRRECLDHVIILSEDHLRKVLRDYFRYYNNTRPMSLSRRTTNPKSDRVK